MVRAGGGFGFWCTYKKTTIVLCSINIIVALYLLRYIYASIYLFNYDAPTGVKYSREQLSKMEESIVIRMAYRPAKLIQLAQVLKEELSREKIEIELSVHTKQMITEEILEWLRTLNSADASEQREAVENWRNEKLVALRTGLLNSTISHEEAGMLRKALESKWEVLMEEIGIYIPDVVENNEYYDIPEAEAEDEEEFDEPLAGRPVPGECNAEVHTDYDGTAVRWGLTNPQESAADCCQACFDQAKNAKPGENKCNIWVYCPSEFGCYSPDIYQHKLNECWLKYSEHPKINFKDNYSESYRNSYPTAPLIVPWVSGVVKA